MDFSNNSDYDVTGCSTASPRVRNDANSNSEEVQIICSPPGGPPKIPPRENPYKHKGDSQFTTPGKLVTKPESCLTYDPTCTSTTIQYAPPTTAPGPDVNVLLLECESYLNWHTGGPHSEENLKLQIDTLLQQHIVPKEQFEHENLARYNALEYISNLGALCYYYIELNNFREAASIIDKTRDVVVPCVRNGFLPADLVDSFDYVWVFIRIHASIKEWEVTNKMTFFPEIDLLNVPRTFDNLAPKVKGGILGLKYYFKKLEAAPYDDQIINLKTAISYDRSFYEWHLCLQKTLRRKRKGLTQSSNFLRTYPWDEEINEIVQCTKLQPNNPRCILAGITLLADFAKFMYTKDQKWTTLRFGDIKFHSMLSIKSYIQEQAARILAACPKSVKFPCAIAEIFSTGLPAVHRMQSLAKDYLLQALKNFPDSSKLNYRLGLYYLTVEFHYVKAEELFRTSYSHDEKNFLSLMSLIQIQMRKATSKDGILEVVDKALTQSHWDKKQEGSLHFYRGLIFCFDSLSKSKSAVEEFVKSFECYEKSIAFYELPHIHRRFGWPQWEVDSKLTYEKIRQRIQRVQQLNADPQRKIILAKILQEIDVAAMTDSKSQSSKKWQR